MSDVSEPRTSALEPAAGQVDSAVDQACYTDPEGAYEAAVSRSVAQAGERHVVAVAGLDLKAPPPRQTFFERFRHSRRAVGGGLFLLVLALLAIFAGYVAPGDPELVDFNYRLQTPIWTGIDLKYVLGGDQLGRDILTRVIYGARISLTIGLLAVLISGTVGVLLGLLAGYYGGKTDEVIMRLADVQLAIPYILLAIALVGIMGPSLRNLIIVMSVSIWMTYARTVRGLVLSLREQQFIEAARTVGGSDLRIIFRHILPNVWTPLIVLASQQVGFVIILESALSYLGLGVPPPTPTWGSMIADGRGYLSTAWHVTTMPGLVLMSTVLAVNFFGDGLRDVLDPKLRM
ncbi:MAG: ABC transporter permease [Chloroflexi bacterium]|nr:ABC transporter permease [Bacteroidota bacterium]MCL5111096.1 ABC transporter permease [Chloroflexota bacterium]